jgi:signal transduction histidine kinase
MGEVFANALAHEQAVKALRTSQAEARQLAGRLLRAQEDESKRLARDLHDDLSQRLAATAIETGKLEQQFPECSELRARMCALKNAVIRIADDVHQISRRIHPAILDDLGLDDALRSECRGFGERHGYAVQYRCGGLPDELPKDVALCFYRIAQEALRNVAKHAKTDAVEVALSGDPEFAYLEVRDSGCGFEPNNVHSKPGLGLASMEERVRLVGGKLTLFSKVGRGTSIAVRIPLPEEVG